MKNKIQNWENEINLITKSFESSCSGLNETEMNHKPKGESSWSKAEIIEHLIKTNESYFPVIEQAKKGDLNLPFLAKFSFFTNLLGKLILKAVSPNSQKKMKTFRVWEPGVVQNSSNIIDRFKAHQNELIRVIKESENLLDKNTVIYSPANKLICYKLETAFDVIVEHEKRHLKQVEASGK